MFHRILFLGLTFMSTHAQADAPRVMADIAPVHSLVSSVMQGVGTPDLIISGQSNPHVNALNTKQARGLQNAEVIFFVGESLTPWLPAALDNLAAGSQRISLMNQDGTIHYPMREGLELDDHHGHEDEDHHDADGVDPHAWLDPQNAIIWANVIAAKLSQMDPENQSVYRQNATNFINDLNELALETARITEPLNAIPLLVFHDAFQYFERRFNLKVIGALLDAEHAAAGANRLRSAQKLLVDHQGACVVAQSTSSGSLLDVLREKSDAVRVDLDVIGSTLQTGPDQYRLLITKLANDLLACVP